MPDARQACQAPLSSHLEQVGPWHAGPFRPVFRHNAAAKCGSNVAELWPRAKQFCRPTSFGRPRPFALSLLGARSLVQSQIGLFCGRRAFPLRCGVKRRRHKQPVHPTGSPQPLPQTAAVDPTPSVSNAATQWETTHQPSSPRHLEG